MYEVGCVKRGTALKLSFEVDAPGSILRYASHGYLKLFLTYMIVN